MFHKTDRLNAGSLRLAKGVMVATLTLLVLCAAASAQTLRSEKIPRNLSPAVGEPIDTYCTKFDEYSDLKFEDEMARLDNFAIFLQKKPLTQGYYLIFGSCEGEADERSQREVDYLVNTRGINRSRITVANSGCRETLTVELWICPRGSRTPTPSNMATVNPCPKCKAKPKPKQRTRRGRHPKS